jgi:hypothetical protein
VSNVKGKGKKMRSVKARRVSLIVLTHTLEHQHSEILKASRLTSWLHSKADNLCSLCHQSRVQSAMLRVKEKDMECGTLAMLLKIINVDLQDKNNICNS